MNELRDHKARLEQQGLTKLPALIDTSMAVAAHAMICDLAEHHGFLRSDGWKVTFERFSEITKFRRSLNKLVRSSDFPKFIDQDIISLVTELTGAPVSILVPGQQVLFTLPEAVDWCIPNSGWHTDSPRLGFKTSVGLQLFTFLDPVRPKGGGTLVVAGSHRLHNESGFLKSGEVKAELGHNAYFNSLFSKTRPPLTEFEHTKGKVDDVELEVVELTGNPGDVYLMDLRLLHTAAANTSNTARLMLTARFPVASLAKRLFDVN